MDTQKDTSTEKEAVVAIEANLETDTSILNPDSLPEETPDITATENEESVTASSTTEELAVVAVDEEESQESMPVRAKVGSPETNRALDMMQLENMIHTQLSDIEKIKEESKELKSAFDDAFKNDATFKDLDEKAKDVAKKKNTYKAAMLKDPAIAKANQEFLAKKDELKDMQSALSDYLREYARTTGLNQFETADGDILEIVQTFRLVRK